MSTKYVVLYESADDVLEKAPAHFPAHSERVDDFHGRGTLMLTGTFADPQEGAMAVFTTREAAEEFIAGDPFVLNGVVQKFEIREWIEVLAP
jgi:uncharacterized protein